MNLYQKINQVRQEILHKTFKADTSGYNYKYMDLPQIETAVTQACDKAGIITIISFEDGYAGIKIIDMDREDSMVEIKVPVDPSMVRINDKQPIQNVGGMMTYMRRYLYMTAFSISEHDAVEDKIAQDKAVEDGEAKGKEASKQMEGSLETGFSEEEQEERVMMLSFLKEIDAKAVEKLMAYKKVNSVDELETSYIRKVYNAKKGEKA